MNGKIDTISQVMTKIPQILSEKQRVCIIVNNYAKTRLIIEELTNLLKNLSISFVVSNIYNEIRFANGALLFIRCSNNIGYMRGVNLNCWIDEASNLTSEQIGMLNSMVR